LTQLIRALPQSEESVLQEHVSAGTDVLVPAAALRLAQRLRTRQAHIAVMGLGYAGLPMAVEFARAGFCVAGLDVDRRRVEMVNSGESPVSDVADDDLIDLLEAGRLTATTELDSLERADVVLVCVPTPLTHDRRPDLSFVRSAGQIIAASLHPGMLIILQSTCSPGTTRKLLLPMLEPAGLEPGRDFFLAYAPERIDPGIPHFTVRNTPKLVGGVTAICTRVARVLFEPIVDHVIDISSPDVAELTKLLENAFRFVNISFINEMAMLADRMGIDIWEAIDAAATKPFAFMPHFPGPGVGGHCIPIVPFFLEAAARDHGMAATTIETAGEVNRAMPHFVVSKLERLLHEQGKLLAGARVLLLGAAYKANTNDVRESPIFPVLRMLRQRGSEAAYYDPWVPTLYYDEVFHVSLTAQEVADQHFDAAVLLTDHSCVDYGELLEGVDLLLDTRGRVSATADLRVPVARL
jgi:UDP-N-acetyl-D-glucosamine dehydrogenase